MYFQSFFNLQPAFLNLTVDQIIFGLLIKSLNLGLYHLQKKSHFRITFIQTVSIPKLFISFFVLKYAPVYDCPKHQQIHVFLFNYYAVIHLVQSQLSVVHLQIGQSNLQILSVQRFFCYLFQHALVKSWIPLFKELKLAIIQNVLCASNFQKLQPLNFCIVFDFLECQG